MWTKVSRKKLKEDQYQECLQKSVNYKIYADLNYLDTLVGKNWFCYVWNDYDAVMPVCFDKKMMQTRVIQPEFCQQLGVFYSDPIHEHDFEEALNLLKKNWVKAYHFNEINSANYKFKGKKHKNYLLSMQPRYEEIQKNFHRKVTKAIKKQESGLTVEKTNSLNALLQFTNEKDAEQNQTFVKIYNSLAKEGKAIIVEAMDTDRNPLAAACWVDSRDEFIYFYAGESEEGKSKDALTVLVDEMIKRMAGSNKTIDFDSHSKIDQSSFYKRFGAKEVNYISVKKFW